jgi:hypothetical protein
VQDAGDENASRFAPEGDDVLAMFHAKQSLSNAFTRTPDTRIIGQARQADDRRNFPERPPLASILSFEGPKGSTDNFTGVFVPDTLDLCQYETFKLGG